MQKFEIDNHYVKLSSYGHSKDSSGKITVKKEVDDVQGKDLIIVEDIVDRGLTLKFLEDYLLNKKHASSLKVCSLLSKPSRRVVDVKIDYLGKEIPDLFIFGYGLDDAGKCRELPNIRYTQGD